MDATFLEDRPFFSTGLLQEESVSEELNWVIPLEFTRPTLVTLPLPDLNPHNIVLPTNQFPWTTYYRRNLIKEVGSPIAQPTLIQDFDHHEIKVYD